MYKFLSAVLAFAVVAIAQPGEGGYIIKSTDGSYSQWSTDQSLNSMADWYTCATADSANATVATKYSTHYRLKQIFNISNTTQKYTLTVLNTGATFKLQLPAQSASGKLPAISRVVGAVADSTVYYFQYK
jgi:hypothetical protein